MKRGSDGFGNARGIFQHIIIPKAQDSKSAPPKKRVPPPIRDAVGMLRTIGFNNKAPFETQKVDDVGRDHMLPPKLCAGHSSIAEHSPPALLS